MNNNNISSYSNLYYPKNLYKYSNITQLII